MRENCQSGASPLIASSKGRWMHQVRLGSRGKGLVSISLVGALLASVLLVMFVIVVTSPSISASPDTIGVTVSISPDNQENLRGGTLTYTVTVKNTGVASDTFKLENGDDLGWPLSILFSRWDNMENTPAVVSSGGSLVWTGGDNIYSLRSGTTTYFWRYSISANSWTAMTAPPDITGGGACIAWSGGDNIYALRGGDRSP